MLDWGFLSVYHTVWKCVLGVRVTYYIMSLT